MQRLQNRPKFILANRNRQTEALCLAAVQKNAAELRWVQNQTPAVCRAAVEKDVRALQFVREPTEDLLKWAVQKNGAALRFVKNQTEELCWLALRSGRCTDYDGDLYAYTQDSGHAIAYIQNPTPEMIGYATRICICGDGSILRDIPASVATEAFYLEYMRNQQQDRECLFDRVLKYIPHTPAILEYVLSHSGLALRHVETTLTQELYELAFKTQVVAISYISHAFQTQAMVEALFDHKDILKDMIPVINPSLLTQAFFEKATLEYELRVFEECPDAYKTQAFCQAVLERNPRFLEFMPNDSVTDAMIEDAIEMDGTCLEYVSRERRTRELCEKALVSSKGRALLDIPAQFWTKPLCDTAFELHPDNIQWIPRAFQTKAMCMKAVESFGGNLRYCRFKTADICQKAIENAPGAYRHVPARLRTEAKAIWVAENGTKYAWRWFRKSDYTDGLCRILLTKSPLAIGRFPPPFQTQDFCRMAIDLFPRAWSSIPKRHRTVEFLRDLLDTGHEGIRSFFQKDLREYDPLYKTIKLELAVRGLDISETEGDNENL